ncbi:MAG: response regulator transcription factor, partial [Coleofasciculaceae cyanobacterium SM2_1_6]|nr:response regulator transcription factor [Coleofasciculaceae cyanobacterium SM2_1_6]
MKKILVIEDEMQTLNIFMKCLEFEGFWAIDAKDGTTGIALAQTHLPDLIICDIMMPDMDGYAVLTALRQLRSTAPIPFIFLTAKVTMTDLRQGMTMGADDYLTKPCSIEQFLTAINTRLDRQAFLQECFSSSAIDSAKALTKDLASTIDTPVKELNITSNARQITSYSQITDNNLDNNLNNNLDNNLNNNLDSIPQNKEVSQKTPGKKVSIFPDCPRLAPVFNFIEAHYHQSISLSDIAKAVGYSPAYLTNLVQELTGHSVKQWVTERRMVQARQLLQNTDQNVRQIAETI